MADSGKPGRSRAPMGAKKSKKMDKSLGKVALASITSNDKLVTEWLAGNMPGLRLATVLKHYGSTFDVEMYDNGEIRQVPVRSLFRHKGSFRNPASTTAVRVGFMVLVEGATAKDGGEIVGILSYEQSQMAKEMAHNSSASSDDSLFNYSNVHKSLAHAAHVANIEKKLFNLGRLRRTKRSSSKSASSVASAASAASAVSAVSVVPAVVNFAALNSNAAQAARAAKLARRAATRRAKRAAAKIAK